MDRTTVLRIGSRAAAALPIALLAALSFVSPISSAAASTANLQPSPVGSGQCQAFRFSDRSVYAQIAVDSATCAVVTSVASGADRARGASYSSDGFACTATREGVGSKWASAWGGTYYAYSCAAGNRKVAFNWGTDYTYGSVGGQSGTTTTHLQPAPLGSGQCQAFRFSDRSVYAQIAVDGATCAVVTAVASGADHSRGASYSSDGFACSATREGAGSKWASAWGGTYYAYSCADGNRQVAFNWGTDYTYT